MVNGMAVGTFLDEIRDLLGSIPGHQGTYDLYERNDFPKVCPWQFDRQLTVAEIVEHIFQPLASKIPQTIQILKEQALQVFALKKADQWFLIYARSLEKSDHKFLCGGAPTSSPQLPSRSIEAGWKTPDELRLFYTVHNGFGPLCPLGAFWMFDAVLPDKKLDTLSSFFARGDKPKLPYNTDDLLLFFPDGAGNGRFFYRQRETGTRIVDWDHETRELTPGGSFWEFVDNRFFKS